MQTDIYFYVGGGRNCTNYAEHIRRRRTKLRPSFVKITDRPNINFTAEANNRFSKKILFIANELYELSKWYHYQFDCSESSFAIKREVC